MLHYSDIPTDAQYPEHFSLTISKAQESTLSAELPEVITKRLGKPDLENIHNLSQHLVYLLKIDFCEQVKTLLCSVDNFLICNFVVGYDDTQLFRTFSCSHEVKEKVEKKELDNTMSFLIDESHVQPVYFDIHNLLYPSLTHSFTNMFAGVVTFERHYIYNNDNIEDLYKQLLGPDDYLKYSTHKERRVIQDNLSMSTNSTSLSTKTTLKV